MTVAAEISECLTSRVGPALFLFSTTQRCQLAPFENFSTALLQKLNWKQVRKLVQNLRLQLSSLASG